MLTALEVKSLKPRAKPYKVADGKGLSIQIQPTGRKVWWYRFRRDGKEATLTLGEWPDMTLDAARAAHRAARLTVQQGIDPVEARRAKKVVVTPTFAASAEQWLAEKKPHWSPLTYNKARAVMDNHLLPALGHLDMRTLTTKDVKPTLLALFASAPVQAGKAREYVNAVVNSAIDAGIREEGQTLRLLRSLPKHAGGHLAAITDKPTDLGKLMRDITAYKGRQGVVSAALRLTAYTAMRAGVVASARWSEIDFEACEWNVPGMEPDGKTARMKGGVAHSVSLPTQAIEVLRQMQALSAGRDYIFPAMARQETPHLHRDSLSRALREMGYQGKHVTHGFRSTLRTMGREQMDIDVDVLERQLAHRETNAVVAAYSRGMLVEKRRKAMQQWADWLDALQVANVVPMTRKAG